MVIDELGRWNLSNLLRQPIRARRRPPTGESAATSAVGEERQRSAPSSHLRPRRFCTIGTPSLSCGEPSQTCGSWRQVEWGEDVVAAGKTDGDRPEHGGTGGRMGKMVRGK